MIAVHGRVRGGTKLRRKGLAKLSHIRAVKQAVSVPVLSNGNVRAWEDVLKNMRFTGADGIMTAEGVLADPSLFSPSCAHAKWPEEWLKPADAELQREVEEAEEALETAVAQEKFHSTAAAAPSQDGATTVEGAPGEQPADCHSVKRRMAVDPNGPKDRKRRKHKQKHRQNRGTRPAVPSKEPLALALEYLSLVRANPSIPLVWVRFHLKKMCDSILIKYQLKVASS